MKNDKNLISVLNVLATQDKQSIEDLMGATGLLRTNVAAVMKGAVPSGLIERNSDDLTRAPVHSITQMGREFLERTEGKAKPKAGAAKGENADLRADLADAQADLVTEKQRVHSLQQEVERLALELTTAKTMADGIIEEQKTALEAKTRRIEAQDAEIQYKAGVIADLSDKLNNGERPPAVKPLGHIVVSGAIVATETYDEALEAAQDLIRKGHPVVTVAAVMAEAEVTVEWKRAA